MSRVARARRIAVTAAYGGGGIGLLGAAFAGLLVRQATLARRAIRPLEIGPPPADGVYGADNPGQPLTMVLLGDSSMVGYGVTTVAETPGSLLGAGLARITNRPVKVVSAAVTGAASVDLVAQLEIALAASPDIAVIFIGGNDVTSRVRPSVAVRYLDHAVRELIGAGARVVVGTCPDLGTIEPIQRPLRWIARRWSRELAAAQTVTVVEAGGRTVSLGDLLGAEFAARPQELFSADRFHPSPAGYARAVAAMLPSVGAALGYGDDSAAAPRPERGEGLRLLPHAAVEAADAAGTEVTPAAIAGDAHGPWGRWVELRHRIRFRSGGDHPAGRPDEDAGSEDSSGDTPGAGPEDAALGGTAVTPGGNARTTGEPSPFSGSVADDEARKRAVEGAW